MPDIEVIVPVRNEEKSIDQLVKRIFYSLSSHGYSFGLIFVDDYSDDNTIAEIKKTQLKYQSEGCFIKVIKKTGPVGKAYSILQGFDNSQAPYIAMIDGDLQYPPEALPKLFELAKSTGIAVAERSKNETGFIRRIGTKLNVFFVEKLILGLNCDTQSGLKVFNREIIENVDRTVVKGWSLDMPLLKTALELGYTISTYNITFTERKSGSSKVKFIKTAGQIIETALRLKLRKTKPLPIKPISSDSPLGAGFAHKGQRFVTHTYLQQKYSAIETFQTWQKIFLVLFTAIITTALVFNARQTAIIAIATLSFAYFLDLLFSLFVIYRSMSLNAEIRIPLYKIKLLKDKDLPVYSILCPLYKEAGVLSQFVKSIKNLDWPKDKLDVLLLLEENDKETIAKARSLKLPSFFRILVVPHSSPKTKPKACNYGLHHARGEYTVIYDAEDRPDPLQLKKVYLGFQRSKNNVACMQCKLNYYNPTQNVLTRLFTAEYTLWFNLILPGFQSLQTSIPLGGTSNHFRTRVLKTLHGWDPFNVTEDADLGTRLFKEGYRTAVVNSTTLEEANSKVRSWIKQRSRWIKGYLQTYLVHMREPVNFYINHGYHAIIFQVTTGMRMLFALINPFLWAITISYFAFRPVIGEAIDAFYPRPVLYIAGFTMIFGNFFYLYIYMIALAKKGYWSLIKYVYLIPVYWTFSSIAAAIAFWQLITKPYYWDKTTHGLHLTPEAKKEKVRLLNLNLKWSGFPGFAKVRQLTSTTYASAGSLVIAAILANFMSFAYNAYLGRYLSIENFGLVALIGNLLYLVQIPTSAINRTITHKSAYHFGETASEVKQIWEYYRPKIFKLSLVATIIWLSLSPLMVKFFNTETILPFILFTPIWVVVTTGAVDLGFIEGNLKFHLIAFLTLTESVVKFISAIIIVSLGLNEWIYLSAPISLTTIFVLGWLLARKIEKREVKITQKVIANFPYKFFFTSILRGLSSAAFLSFDVILAKHYLTSLDAGRYALLSLVGKMIYLAGTMFSQFTLSVVSKAEGAGNKSKNVFYKVLLAVIAVTTGAFVVLGLFGQYTLPILLGNKVNTITSELPLYALSMVLFSIAFNISTYHQIKKQYIFPVFGFAMAVLQVIAFYFNHRNVHEFVEVMVRISTIYFSATVFLHFIYDYFIAAVSNTKDLFGLFGDVPSLAASGNKKNILIFNWRDIKHVWAGGAEVYIHELAKRWVGMGYKVTLFCGNDGHHSRNEIIDGINVIRRGGFFTVYLWAAIYYLLKLRKNTDIIIDCENGIPFFTPLYSRKPIIGLVHHVHSEIILKELNLPFFKLPVALLAQFLETKIMPRVYRNYQMVTVSSSSKHDMHRIGFLDRSLIEIINPGVDLTFLKPGKKAKKPTVLYLGRLAPYKSIDTLIKAIAKLKNTIPEIELNIAGYGESRRNLERLAEKLHITSSVKFLGRVSEEEKARLLRSAWVFAYPSRMEGWGISIIEANASGTPVVASDVPGLRDSVRNPSTGFLVEYKNSDAFAEKIEKLIVDKKLRKRFNRYSISWAKNFTWDKAAEKYQQLFMGSQSVKN